MGRNKLFEKKYLIDSVDDLCWQLGVSDDTYYAWKKKHMHLGVRDLRGFGSWKKKTLG